MMLLDEGDTVCSPKHTDIVHVQQNLKANTFNKKDGDYMIKDGEVFLMNLLAA